MTLVPETVVERAPAKVNLALHVLRRRADGYHELDSLAVFMPQVADVLHVSAANESGLEVGGAPAAGVPADERNLALRAARALIRRWPRHFGPVHIRLEKRLPAAAGIGGGSADAAAVMRAMCRLFGFSPPPAELMAVALELGADVPVCLHGRAVRMRGIGERLTAVAIPAGLGVVLANPGVRLATAEVFSRLAEMRRRNGQEAAGGLPDDWPMQRGAFLDSLARLRNDLEAPARALAPAIADCLQALRTLFGARLARMSGSGATCFALFDTVDAARAAAEKLRAQHPRWWVATGKAV